jgi:hypothetical protein
LYDGERRMFHGPLFQAVCATERQGEEGIEGRLRALPHRGLFRSIPAPELLTDPLLIDASTHLLGAWHLSRPDPEGRVVFPYEIGVLDIYAPPPPAGTEVGCRVRVERRTSRQVRHRIELIHPDGRLWCRLDPADYWRFYWPQEYVDFFRFKEDYLLAFPWPRLSDPADPVPPHHVTRSAEGRPGGRLRLDMPADLRQPVLRSLLARIALSRREWQEFRALRMPDAQITEWLCGRIAAKDAARAAWWGRQGERLCPADLEAEIGPSGEGSVRRLDRPDEEPIPVKVVHIADAVLSRVEFGAGDQGRRAEFSREGAFA